MDGDGLADDLADFDEHAAGAGWIEAERGRRCFRPVVVLARHGVRPRQCQPIRASRT